MSDRIFEETKQFASNNLDDMSRELARLTRTYNNYLKHGAVNAAAELLPELEWRERDIEAEESNFTMTFN